MSLTIHAVSGAPRARRVLVGLAIKNLDYNINYLQASKGEHKSPEFLKLNPRGTVPVLETNGLILSESIGILAWLDRKYPTKPLFGRDTQEAGEIWQVVLELNDYFRAAINNVFLPILVQGIDVPNGETKEGKALIEAANTLRNECKNLEILLNKDAFLCGDAASAADAIAFPEISLIQRSLNTKPDHMKVLGLDTFWRDFPKLEAWKIRVEALPEMNKTMPPHWAS